MQNIHKIVNPHLVFVLVEQWQLHFLTGGGCKLAARGCVCGVLLLVATHADQKEEAGNDKWDGNAGDQDVKNLLFEVLWWHCGCKKKW